jgi:hypothetical protein
MLLLGGGPSYAARCLLALQAAMQAHRLEAEAKVASLTTDLSAAQASCADLNSQLQQSLQGHEASKKSLQEQHQAALDTLQVKLSDQEQQLQAASAKAEEDKAAMAAASHRILERDAQIKNLKHQLAGDTWVWECVLHTLIKAMQVLYVTCDVSTVQLCTARLGHLGPNSCIRASKMCLHRLSLTFAANVCLQWRHCCCRLKQCL